MENKELNIRFNWIETATWTGAERKEGEVTTKWVRYIRF